MGHVACTLTWICITYMSITIHVLHLWLLDVFEITKVFFLIIWSFFYNIQYGKTMYTFSPMIIPHVKLLLLLPHAVTLCPILKFAKYLKLAIFQKTVHLYLSCLCLGYSGLLTFTGSFHLWLSLWQFQTLYTNNPLFAPSGWGSFGASGTLWMGAARFIVLAPNTLL